MKNRSRPLTEDLIAATTCPPERQWRPLWDATQPGLVVRIYRTGTKSYWYRYRIPGAARSATPKWVQIGKVTGMSLKAARDAARVLAGEVAKGGDPAADRRRRKRQVHARLAPALERYEESLAARHVVKRDAVLSVLRRELLAPFGDIDIATLDRAMLVERIDAVRRSGRPGAAKELRTRAGVFLGWAVDQGLIVTNPLAGWRQPRRTRAERIARRGRALKDVELPVLWRAADAQAWPFGPYLQILLLLGQRRTETSLMAWSDLVLDDGAGQSCDGAGRSNVWIVRPEITKSGRTHRVPLSRQAVAILRTLPRLNKCDLVFPGRKGKPMSGWSKRLRDVYAATAADGMPPWAPHDLRRTMRTGLGTLGVEPVVAELLLDHAISDTLARLYDLGDYWEARIYAAQRWADRVFARLQSSPPPGRTDSNVVDLAEARR